MNFNIGPVTIHLYGIIIMTGAIAGAFLARYQARRMGEDPEFVWDVLVWLILGGIIGARLWHVFTPPPSMVARGITTAYYLSHPLDALAIWRGGLGIPGAVIGGVIVLYLFARRRQAPFVTWLDITAPALALGQAIGRWGNYVNQELYGAPSNLPWAIFIEPHNRFPAFMQQATYHPTFLYESLWNLANMLLLLFLSRRFADRLRPGDIFLTYLMFYPLGRFFLEFVRLDSSQVGGLNINQTFMAVVALTAAAVFVYRRRERLFVSVKNKPGEA